MPSTRQPQTGARSQDEPQTARQEAIERACQRYKTDTDPLLGLPAYDKVEPHAWNRLALDLSAYGITLSR